MRYITFLIVPIIVSGILALLKRGEPNVKEGNVFMPKFFLIFGLIISTLFFIPTVITAFLKEPIWVTLIFFALSLLGAAFIIAYVNCKITYNEEGFVAKSFLGIKRKYTYDQVTSLRENAHEDYLYVGKRRVMIDEFAVGGPEFIAYVRKQYRKMNDGKQLPKFQKNRFDIFNGNVRNPGEFVFIFALIAFLILAIAVFIVWHVFFFKSTVDNTVAQNVTFISCEVKDDEIVMISSDNALYKIVNFGDDLDIDELSSVCDGSTPLTAYSKEITPKNGDDYYSLKAICKDDSYLISLEDSNRWHREQNWKAIFIPIGFAVYWGIIVGCSVIVGRNPKKFGRKVVRLFFKDGYVKF